MSINLLQFFKWVQRTFTDSYKKEIEQYLADATDHFDLEHRMKHLMQRGMI